MNIKTVKFLVFLLLIFAYPMTASAFRCGTQIVNEGDLWHSVLKKCGDPDGKKIYEKEVSRARAIPGEIRVERDFVQVEQWIYDYSPNGFIYTLTFYNGELVEIEANRER